MKILCVDVFGESVLDWCLRCQAAGHEVKLYVAEAKGPVGQGLVPVVKDWHPWQKWADLVFLPDNIRFLEQIDAWRRRDPKLPIVAPSVETASWELDRLKGQKILSQHNIETLACREFTDYQAAVRFVKANPEFTVCKPCGDETDKALSYVASNPAAMVSKLELWQRQQRLTKGSFVLQEKVEGVEMGVAGWFSPIEGFTGPWEEAWEHKGLFPGNKGPSTGEMGTVQRFVTQSRLADLMLRPLEDTLARERYFGNVSVNCIITDDGTPCPLEFTMRPGWPAFNIQLSLMESDPAEWLIDLWEGHPIDTHFSHDEIAVGVVMVIPPYPYSHEKRDEVTGQPVYGIDRLENVHPCMMCWQENPQHEQGHVLRAPGWATAGSYVLVATGTAATVHDARTVAYNVLERLDCPAKPYWRDDIGEKLRKDLPKVQRHGLATGMSY